MKLAKVKEFYFNDKIDIEVIPAQLLALIRLMEKDSFEQKDYISVGRSRELKDILQERYDVWRRERKKQNEKERIK